MSDMLQDQIVHVLDHHRVGILTTLHEKKPHSRLMTFSHEDLVLYSPINRRTFSVEEIEKQETVHILLGYEWSGSKNSYVEIEALAKVEESEEIRERFWTDDLLAWIDEPKEHNYLLVQFTPQSIRFFKDGKSKAQTL
ncbi:hypothetical protein AMD01_19190 [Priestia koreensis]|uniref:Pyridoxamine 5'-phosphate oxidase N-terminal domain-containing protein n=2 Tax=Priestia koreensis TaxID=284581 RepID=A0A0M0KR56_9BACI|nr:hypothetical protein AMD01_19190 [Priestia koreensis]